MRREKIMVSEYEYDEELNFSEIIEKNDDIAAIYCDIDKKNKYRLSCDLIRSHTRGTFDGEKTTINDIYSIHWDFPVKGIFTSTKKRNSFPLYLKPKSKIVCLLGWTHTELGEEVKELTCIDPLMDKIRKGRKKRQNESLYSKIFQEKEEKRG